jgi:hypothetical protein
MGKLFHVKISFNLLTNSDVADLPGIRTVRIGDRLRRTVTLRRCQPQGVQVRDVDSTIRRAHITLLIPGFIKPPSSVGQTLSVS